MMDPFEVARKIFNLPAFVRADLFALDAATGTCSFSRAKLVDLRGHRKIFEVGKIAPALAPLHAPKLFCRFAALWKIFRINRLQIHFLGEDKKHLCQSG